MNILFLLVAALVGADLHFQRHDIVEYPSPYQVAVKVLWHENK